MTQTLTASGKRVRVFAAMLIVLVLMTTFATASAGGTGTAAGTGTCTLQHLVRPGDTLALIAHVYNTTVADLETLNSISDPNLIFWGTKLCVSKTETPTPSFAGTYVVQTGDTLGFLASHFGVQLHSLLLSNNIVNPNLIFAGETISVPPPAP